MSLYCPGWGPAWDPLASAFQNNDCFLCGVKSNTHYKVISLSFSGFLLTYSDVSWADTQRKWESPQRFGRNQTQWKNEMTGVRACQLWTEPGQRRLWRWEGDQEGTAWQKRSTGRRLCVTQASLPWRPETVHWSIFKARAWKNPELQLHAPLAHRRVHVHSPLFWHCLCYSPQLLPNLHSFTLYQIVQPKLLIMLSLQHQVSVREFILSFLRSRNNCSLPPRQRLRRGLGTQEMHVC